MSTLPTFTQQEIELLKQFVTDPIGDVFVVTGPKGLIGAIYARYSRAPGGFRQTLLKEFLKTGLLDAKRANDLIDRVLVGYGDDSVGELEGAHLALENVSILITKDWEDRRIGGSPIEQSTRYVFFDMKVNGRYRFHVPEEITGELREEYETVMNETFTLYSNLITPMMEFYKLQKPEEQAMYAVDPDQPKRKFALAEIADDEKLAKAWRQTYNADVRTKTCDTLRCLLPLATQTNVGYYGNGRFYSHALTYCYSSSLAESRNVAARAHKALDEAIPKYVARSKASPYLIKVREDMKNIMQKVLKAGLLKPSSPEPGAHLLDHGEQYIADQLVKMGCDAKNLRQLTEQEQDTLKIAAMLYPYASHSLNDLRKAVRNMSGELRDEIWNTYVNKRETRRDRPGRAFEFPTPNIFDCLHDFGTYKDLERHRMSTQLRQLFTVKNGFQMPEDIVKDGRAEKITELLKKTEALFDRINTEVSPEVAQYVVMAGHYIRWVIGNNDRGLHHLVELRTGPQGHSGYRKEAQNMQKAVAEENPKRGAVMNFTDHNDYSHVWARGDAEAAQRIKERLLEARENQQK